MTNENIAELNAAERVDGVIKKHNTLFKTLVEFPPVYAIFRNTLTLLLDALRLQQNANNSASLNALSANEIMAETIYLLTLRAKVLVNNPTHLELYSLINKPKGYYTRGAKLVRVQRAKDVRNDLNDNLSILTNIKDGDIKEIDAAIAAYDEAKNEPEENIKTIKANATDMIPIWFEQNDKAIDDIYGLAASYFSKSNPTVVNEYALAMQVVNTAVRHTSISFDLMDAISNKPLVGAEIIDKSNNKTYITNEEGEVHVNSHKSGRCHFTIKADGKPDKDFLAIIKRGTENTFEIML